MKTLAIACLVAGACSTGPRPSPTGTPCADPDPITGTTMLTWDNFGHDFMFKYCTNCHSSDLPLSKRNGASLFHDFDSLAGVREICCPIPIPAKPSDHIDEQSGIGPNAANRFMPGDGTDGRCPSQPGGPLDEQCPMPTDAERVQLAQWLACERLRTPDLVDAGIPDAP